MPWEVKILGFIKDVLSFFSHDDVATNQGTTVQASVPLSDTDRLLTMLGVDGTNREAISEATYFTCLKLLSETMGKLPLKYYQQTEKGRLRAKPTAVTRLLTVSPNPYMTPTTLITLTEMFCQHKGNGFIYVDSEIIPEGRYGGRVDFKGLYPLDPDYVTIWIDNAGIFKNRSSSAVYYEYRDPVSLQSHILPSEKVIHIKTWYTKNGISSEPVRTILRETISAASESQAYMSNLYKEGLTASMVMQYTGELDDARIKQLQTKFADRLTGPQAAGKVIPIPLGLQLQPLNQSLTDAQFYELKQYSALQIAAAFGVKPNQINDYGKSSYSSSEQQQLAFLVDTMQYRLKIWEEELNAKLLMPSEKEAGFFYKFNERAILRADAKTQMETLAQGVNNALYMPNEGREILDLPDAPGGDILMCNGNYIPITQVGQQYSGDAVSAVNSKKGGSS